MSIVTNVITPIIQMMVYVFMAGGIIYFCYRIMKNFIPNLTLVMKYKIFRMKYKEKDVEWCMNAIKEGMSDIEIKKKLLINGNSNKRIREMIYILEKVKIEMKGGID